jgi:hypothetical protein
MYNLPLPTIKSLKIRAFWVSWHGIVAPMDLVRSSETTPVKDYFYEFIGNRYGF